MQVRPLIQFRIKGLTAVRDTIGTLFTGSPRARRYERASDESRSIPTTVLVTIGIRVLSARGPGIPVLARYHAHEDQRRNHPDDAYTDTPPVDVHAADHAPLSSSPRADGVA